MKINQYKVIDLNEDHVDVYYKEMNSEIQAVFDYLTAKQALIGRNEKIQVVIKPYDIYYCEVVDKKVFAYLTSEVYQLDLSLQHIVDTYSNNGFVRVSKSMAVNIYKVKQLKADINMRVNIIMENGEIIVMNRSYKKGFYQYLKELEGAVRPNE